MGIRICAVVAIGKLGSNGSPNPPCRQPFTLTVALVSANSIAVGTLGFAERENALPVFSLWSTTTAEVGHTGLSTAGVVPGRLQCRAAKAKV